MGLLDGEKRHVIAEIVDTLARGCWLRPHLQFVGSTGLIGARARPQIEIVMTDGDGLTIGMW